MPGELLLALVPRLAFVGFNLAQPFLLLRVVSHVSQGAIDGNITRGLIGASALVFTGIAVSTVFGSMSLSRSPFFYTNPFQISRAIHEHMQYRMATMVRGVLVTAIYHKVNCLALSKLENSAAMTLMTTDAEGVSTIISSIYTITAASIQVGLGIWALSRFVGPVCLVILIPGIGKLATTLLSCTFFLLTIQIVATFAASIYLSKKMSAARVSWNEHIELRVAAASNILAQVKAIKLMGLAGPLADHLQQLRNAEIAASMADRRARLCLFASGMQG